MSLTIEHTDDAGTLLDGTSRGDGTAQIVKALGWRWGRSITSWYVPRSRGRAPQRVLIERTAQQLRDAGHDVAITIDTTPADRRTVEAARAAQSQQRAERLTARADREQARAEERHATARQIGAGIPLGQPILLGHHSQARAERDRDRIAANMDKSIEHQAKADRARTAAAAAERAQAARHNPVTVANRIERIAADIRRAERSLSELDDAGAPPEHRYRIQLDDQLSTWRADLAYWQEIRAAQLADGIAGGYSPETVAVGDLVKIGGSWHKVARANTKTVAVETCYSWTNKSPWHTVTDHRPAQAAQKGN